VLARSRQLAGLQVRDVHRNLGDVWIRRRAFADEFHDANVQQVPVALVRVTRRDTRKCDSPARTKKPVPNCSGRPYSSFTYRGTENLVSRSIASAMTCGSERSDSLLILAEAEIGARSEFWNPSH
jgi:hypothetical protein